MKQLLATFLFLLFCAVQAHGQILFAPGLEDINYKTPREYTIGDITISGVENLDNNVIVLLSGLRVGDVISVPGEEIANAIISLWKQDLFEDIVITATKIEGNDIYLDIYLKELPRLSKYSIRGVKKSQVDDLRDIMKLTRGKVVNQNLINSAKVRIRNYYVEKGYTNVGVEHSMSVDSSESNLVIIDFRVKPGNKLTINSITFEGNETVESAKLRKQMKNTRQKGLNIFKSSKFLKKEYQEDQAKIIAKYNELGYRDARIVRDSVYKHDEESINIHIVVEEGKKYYFRNITFLGNQKHSSDFLAQQLGIVKGDVFDQSKLESRLFMSMEGNDISSIYLDDGYLFFDIQPVEIYAENDSIDIEIRIREGKQARINQVTVSGNTRTNDHVIFREIQTRPGQLFSRSDIIRTTRILAQTGFFDPEQLNPVPRPNPETGTVDIEYQLVERSTSQVELQGGWGGNRIVGTLGLVFDNFSARKVFKKDGWKPLPQGDGQRLSLRLQSNGPSFQSYNASFTEPWMGGKKPHSLTFSAYHSVQSNGLPNNSPQRQDIRISGIGIGLGQRLQWPDSYFTLYQQINMQVYNLNDYAVLQSTLGYSTGVSRAFSYTFTIGRNSVDSPIYPRVGSNISLTIRLTPPYSLLNDKDYTDITNEEKYEQIEYHKWKVDAAFYTRIVGDLVVKTAAHWGFLGMYNGLYGYSPFERFFVGGDGLQGFVLDGREIIGLRGYPNLALSPSTGGVMFNKFTLEFRYPLSLNPSATIYALAFAEGGNSWETYQAYKPFDIKRAVGGGVRIFMPMFGMLGVDFGYGFDSYGAIRVSGWQTHFILGQQF
jgi:outer membrane protein insertion porin family